MPRTRKTISAADPALLTAALEGLELQRARLEEQIRAVRSALGVRRRGAASTAAPAAEAAQPRRRKLSAAARKRIAAAQKKRWAEYRKKKGAGE